MPESATLSVGDRRARRGFALIAALVAVAASISCSDQRRLNVLLVTFDTTRADHIGCYGNETVDTPVVDGLAEDGVRFAHAYSALPVTAPSHTTIMTGKYPMAHGVRDNGLFVLSEDQLTLAEGLRRQGWATAAAIAGFPLVSRFGLNQGFDLYDDRLERPSDEFFDRMRLARPPRLFFDERKAARVNEAVFDWIDEHHQQPFFLWIHYYDPHQPHEPPPPYDQQYVDDPYDGEIAYADECLGVLLAKLRRLGVYDRTLVVLTADHGEGLGEHGEETHSFLLYDTTLHVPLIIRHPAGPRGMVIDQRVGLVDLMPTILDAVGVERPSDMQGRSLMPVLAGGDPGEVPRYYAETLSPRLTNGWGELRALFDGRWKYVHGPRVELFDLADDPHELRNLVDDRPEVAARMRTGLEGFLEEFSVRGTTRVVPADDETREKLIALGYLQGGDQESTPIHEQLLEGGTAPQDRVGDVGGQSLARELLHQGRALDARGVIQRLLEGDPDNSFYLELMVLAELQLGRLDEVIEIVDSIPSASEQKRQARLLLHVGHLYYSRDELDRAESTVRRSLELEPSAPGYYLMASIQGRRGRTDAEVRSLEDSLRLDPTFPPARVDRAVHYAQSGDAVRAERAFRQALEDQPYFARAHFNYGAFLLEQGNPSAALDRFERAAELDPGYLQAYHGTVLCQVSLDRIAEARATLATLEAIAPSSEETERARRIVEENS